MDHLEYRRLRAPRGEGQAVIDPPLDVAAEVLQQNRRLAESAWTLAADRQALRADARRETLELAVRHCRRYRDCDPPPADAPWIASGHQPRLFHPGVWFKNFALAELAARHSAVALNLIVDNDICQQTSIRVPVSDGPRWAHETVAWDDAPQGLPFEEQRVRDQQCFRSFARRAAAAVAPLVEAPLVSKMWPVAVQRLAAGDAAGACLAAARHQLEAAVGLDTLEVPLSGVFQLPAVCRWTAAVLTEPMFLETYNQLLRKFRKLNRIRSRSHPVPDLQRDGDWREAPFWVWTDDDLRRRRLFLRQRRQQCELEDRQGWKLECRQASLPEALAALPASGVRLRPRALTTTLLARTVLSDLFLHGIGGAKYDQLNDALMEKLWAISPPGFVTLTATLRLRDCPVDALERRIGAARQQLRDLVYNPQRHLAEPPEDARAAELAAEKLQWIGRRQDLAARHQAIRRVNSQLQPAVEPLRQRLLQQLSRDQQRLQGERKLASREHAFCLFDEEKLPAKLLDLCQDPE